MRLSLTATLFTCLSISLTEPAARADIQSTDYPSIQAPIDANPEPQQVKR